MGPMTCLHGYAENTVEMSEADDVLVDKEVDKERATMSECTRPMFAHRDGTGGDAAEMCQPGGPRI